MTTIVERYHDFSAGHRVVGHEGACKNIHGHNYRVTFTCSAKRLDKVGRVIDFNVIKQRLCVWLEKNWDHRMLLWIKDPWSDALSITDKTVVLLPFNPTAENLAKYLLEVVGPAVFKNTKVKLIKVKVEETRKCSATVALTS